jgi:hypothetical protein
MKITRRRLLNLAICLGAFLFGTVAAFMFLTCRSVDDARSLSRHRSESKSESATNNAPNARRETEASKPISAETVDRFKTAESNIRHPIIEIWKALDGAVAIRGRSLHFRMYDDATAEFDYVLRKRTYTDGTVEFEYESRTAPITPPRRTKSVEASLESIPLMKISEEEFSRFKSSLADLSRSKDIKREYKPVGLTLDVLVKLTILFKETDTDERKIIINNSDLDVVNTEFEKVFPNSLVNLTKEVHAIKTKLFEHEKEQKKSER